MDKKYAEYLMGKTRDDYNAIAEDFSRTNEEIWSEFKFLLEDYLSPKDKVLDLGCGNGRFFELFKEKNSDYFGIDVSDKLIEIAKKKYPNGNFQIADSLNLPFPENFFDKIYNIAVLHHFPSKELRLQLLNEIKRTLKPGGIFILTVRKFHYFKDLFLIFKSTILKISGFSKLDFGDFLKPWGTKTTRFYHQFSAKELINLAEEAGFKVLKSGFLQYKDRQNLYLVAEKSAKCCACGLNSGLKILTKI